LRFEKKRSSGLWNECEQDDLNINGENFNEDEDDLNED
jgi:hypothetical protein